MKKVFILFGVIIFSILFCSCSSTKAMERKITDFLEEESINEKGKKLVEIKDDVRLLSEEEIKVISNYAAFVNEEKEFILELKEEWKEYIIDESIEYFTLEEIFKNDNFDSFKKIKLLNMHSSNGRYYSITKKDFLKHFNIPLFCVDGYQIPFTEMRKSMNFEIESDECGLVFFSIFSTGEFLLTANGHHYLSLLKINVDEFEKCCETLFE